MKLMIKCALILLLAAALFTGLWGSPASAVGTDVVSVAAGYSSGTVSVSGTTESGVLAVAVMVYSGDTLLRLETTGVTSNAFSTEVALTLSSGVYIVRAADYDGGAYAETVLTVAAPPSTEPVIPGLPAYQADVSGGDSLAVDVNPETSSATVNLEAVSGNLAQGNTVVSIPIIPGVHSYSASLPAASLSGSAAGSLTVNTGVGNLILPGNMLSGTGLSGKAEITIGMGDNSALPDDVKKAIGSRPVIQLTLLIDGEQTNWNNPSAAVTVCIPYTPTAAELANSESIVVWYIDGSGNAVSVPNGRYDPSTGTVTFETTHFSEYAVAFNRVLFSDVSESAWYGRAVSFIAARNITEGTGGGKYSPNAKLTRGEFIVLLMRAYGIAADGSTADNFDDAGNTYYTGYLAAAKRLGISSGVGENRYAPDKVITRQELFTLLYNALRVIGQLPEGNSGRTPDDFSDAAEIDEWARDAMTLFVKTGFVSGSAGKLAPRNTSTRAEMAQVLYTLLKS